MSYRVMEYLDPTRSHVQGYVFLDDEQFRKWERSTRTADGVRGYAVVIGMESCAEHGMVACYRLWDYGRCAAELPEGEDDVDAWLLKCGRAPAAE